MSNAIRKNWKFLNYGTELVLFLAVLENSALTMGYDSSHATLNVTSEL